MLFDILNKGYNILLDITRKRDVKNTFLILLDKS